MQELHNNYRKKFDEYLTLQKKCSSGVNHQRYRLKAIVNLLRHVRPTTEAEKQDIADLEKDIQRRQAQLTQVRICSLVCPGIRTNSSTTFAV